ncbi:MAG: energy transducer TonB [candidate division KSB1 bacterium]|nr:energy transducer TonB [candidate division KSB1 bacterium]
MYLRKKPEVSLKLKYKKQIEFGLVLALALVVGLFQAFKRVETRQQIQQKVDLNLDVEQVQATEQQSRQEAPSRPTIPIESEDEDIPEDLTIESTEINLDEMPPPPPPPEESGEPDIFLAYDEPPEPIGGFAAIQRNLEYPEIARKAGVEGRVIIQCVIDEKGNVVSTNVVKTLGNNGCDEAAIRAIKSVKWKPAKQRDKPVAVRVAIPVVFKLK